MCKVTYARTLKKTLPAKVFLDDSEEKARAKFLMLFQRMADLGTLRCPDDFRPKVGIAKYETRDGRTEDYKVAEFKVHYGPGYRILACRNHDEWVLTNGFKKGAVLAKQVKTAEKIFREHLSQRTAEN